MRAVILRIRARAFSLLEVMVAVGILGLTLTVILSAQGGLAASNKMAANMGIASTVGRCKMTELEERLIKLGYPLVDDLQTEVACCNDNSDTIFTCDTRVEKVILPNPPTSSLDGGGGLSLASVASAASAGAAGSLPGALGGAGGLGAIAPALGANGAGGAGLDLNDGGLQGMGAGLMQQLGAGGTGSTAQGMQGLMQMVMGMVYPSLKLMFEASIRRVTVVVKWKEGPNPKTFELTEYLTSPQQAGFTAGSLSGLDGGLPGLGGPGGTTMSAPPAGLVPAQGGLVPGAAAR